MADPQLKGTVLQWCLFIIFTLGFLVFLAPVFTGILNEGNVIGMLLCGILAAGTLFHRRLAALLVHKPVKIIAVILAVLAAVGIIIFAVISVKMIAAACKKPTDEKVVVVLGCRVKGEKPSLMLAKRIDAAYECLAADPDMVAILSGGQGDDELISEAECMYRELTKKGIAPERLIKEERSTNTYENISFSKEIMDKLGLEGGIVIATSEFHQCRAQIVAAKQGIEASAASAHTALFLLPTYWIRDCGGVFLESISR